MKVLIYLLLCLPLLTNSFEVHEDIIDRNIDCLAKNIYHEARGESVKGQIAVAHVTMNRVVSGKYPSTVCDVVYQKRQFSWTSTKKRVKSIEAYQKIRLLAEKVFRGETTDPTKGALNFHAKTVSPGWNKRTKAIIGNHVFY